MFIYNDKEYRSLQEQVQENKEQIAMHWNVDRVLADFGIQVLGRVETTEDLPADEGENWGYGYLVGLEAPYDVYVWTRPNADAGEPDAYWLNIGKISIVGPEGPQGPKGEKGDKGDKGDTGAQGPQGVQGPKGDKGDTGTQGPRGEQGPQGPAGTFNIKGTLLNESLLPSAAEASMGDAYLVLDTEVNAYDLYIIAGEEGNYYWQNTGILGAGTTITVGGQAVDSWNSDTKLDKITLTASYDRAYIIKADGTQGRAYIGYPSTIPSTTNYIAARNSQGDIRVPLTPGSSNMAASKQYVDNAVANAGGGGLDYNIYINEGTSVEMPMDGSWRSAKFIIVDLIGYDYDSYANHFTACFIPDRSSYQYIDSNRDGVQFYAQRGYEEQISALFTDEDTQMSYQSWLMKVITIN